MHAPITLYDPLTVDDAEAFPPVQKKLKLDTDAKPQGKCACINLSAILYISLQKLLYFS